MHFGKAPESEVLPCTVCKEPKEVQQEILRGKEEIVKLCKEPNCLATYKFVNSVETTK